jgi:hypothetical protein
VLKKLVLIVTSGVKRADDRGIGSQLPSGARHSLLHSILTAALRPTQLPIRGLFFAGVKWPELETAQYSESRAEVTNV